MIDLSPEDQAEINRLAATFNEKHQRFVNLGMMNVNAPPEQRLALSQQYAVAQAESLNAHGRLQEAISRVAAKRV